MDAVRWWSSPLGLLLMMLSGLFWLVVLIRGLILVVGPRPVNPSDALWTISVVMVVAVVGVLGGAFLLLQRLLERLGSGGRRVRRLKGGVAVMQGGLVLLLGGFLVVIALAAVPGWGPRISWTLLTMRLGVGVVASVVPSLLGVWGGCRLREGFQRMGRPDEPPDPSRGAGLTDVRRP